MYQEREIGHKCANCGFLAVRNRFTRQLDEAERRFRDTGEFPLVPRIRPPDPNVTYDGPMLDRLYEVYPVCFQQKTLFEAEIWQMAQGKSNQNTPENEGSVWQVKPHDIRDYIRQHACDDWFRWQQGSTPKEHLEIMGREAVRKWQKEREEDDREWRASQRREDRWWHIAELIVLGVLVAAATLFSGYVARSCSP